MDVATSRKPCGLRTTKSEPDFLSFSGGFRRSVFAPVPLLNHAEPSCSYERRWKLRQSCCRQPPHLNPNPNPSRWHQRSCHPSQYPQRVKEQQRLSFYPLRPGSFSLPALFPRRDVSAPIPRPLSPRSSLSGFPLEVGSNGAGKSPCVHAGLMPTSGFHTGAS